MSEIQEIDLYVKPDGSVKFEIRGVKGQKCLDITKEIEKHLGGEIIERIHTDEFNEVEREQSQDTHLRQNQ